MADDVLDSIPEPYKIAHLASFRNKEKLLASRWVGCFYCITIYGPKGIREWVDGGETALCPICHIDSVMPLTAEQFDSDFLEQMHDYWFDAHRGRPARTEREKTPPKKGTMVQ